MSIKKINNLILIFFLGSSYISLGQAKFTILPDQSSKKTININMPVGVHYQDFKKAVALIKFDGESSEFDGEYSSFSGTVNLVSTVNQDGSLYLLTCAHCVKKAEFSEDPLYISFKREALPPTSRTEVQDNDDLIINQVEAEVVFMDLYNDIALVKINTLPPDLEERKHVYYAGWNLDKSARGVTLIGHPADDLKKIWEWSEFQKANQIFTTNYIDVTDYQTIEYETRLNFSIFAESETGLSGSGVLDDKKRIISLFSASDEGDGDLLLSSPLWLSWIERSDPFFKETPFYSFPTIETPYLQKFLDPNFTYVSKVPGGYGFIADPTLTIPDNNFDLQIQSNGVFKTPEFNSENGDKNMVKLNLWELYQSTDSEPTKSEILQKAGIYSKDDTANLKLTIEAYDERRNGYTKLLETNTTSITHTDGRHFKNNVMQFASKEELKNLFGLFIDIDENFYEKIKLLGFDYDLPVVIKVENLGSTATTLRALRIPGLGYRNAVELFTPVEFEALYKDLSYPQSIGSTGSPKATPLPDDSSSPTNLAAILETFEISQPAEVDTDANQPSVSNVIQQPNSFKFNTEDNGGYINLIQHIINLEVNTRVNVTYTSKTEGETKKFGLWIDLNENNRFNANERFINSTRTEKKFTTSFTIGEEGVDDDGVTTRMRVGYRTVDDLPDFADEDFTNGEMEDYTVHIYKDSDEEIEKEATTTSVFNNPLKVIRGILSRLVSLFGRNKTTEKCFDYSDEALVNEEAPFVTYKDDNGDYKITDCTQIQVTSHNTNNELYALSFKNGTKTYYIDVDIESERQPVQFQGSTLLSYELKFVESTTPIYVKILRVNDDENQLVFKHAQVDAYSFTYAITSQDTYQINQLDDLSKNITTSHTTASVLGTLAGGLTIGGGVLAGGYFYATPLSSEEIGLISNNNEGVFGRATRGLGQAIRRVTLTTTNCFRRPHAD